VIIFFAIAANTGMGDIKVPNDNSQTSETVAKEESTPTAEVKKEEPKVEPAMEVTATGLVAEFKENGVAAEQKYGDKRIRVTGVVHSIDKDILDTPYVALSGDQYGINNVQCMFPKDRAGDLVSFKKDTRATVEGVFSSNLMNVLLKDCTVVTE
jgi:tRNA_anti-like